MVMYACRRVGACVFWLVTVPLPYECVRVQAKSHGRQNQHSVSTAPSERQAQCERHRNSITGSTPFGAGIVCPRSACGRAPDLAACACPLDRPHTMAPSTFSLLNAILKADGSPHVPDLWRSSLLRDHMDSESRSAVAQTCQPGLRWLLTEWQSPALHVPVRASSAEQDPRALLRRMQGARRQLNKFSALHAQPVTLVLEQEGSIAAHDKWWQIALAGLSDAGPRLPIFTLTLQLQHIPAPLISLADQVFSGLETLRVQWREIATHCEVQLPPAEQLTALRDLTIDWVDDSCQESMWASLKAYLTQLRSLTIDEQPEDIIDSAAHSDDGSEHISAYRRPLWSTAFQQVVSDTLTQLKVAWDLHPWLVKLLCKATPVSLEHMEESISIHSIYMYAHTTQRAAQDIRALALGLVPYMLVGATTPISVDAAVSRPRTGQGRQRACCVLMDAAHFRLGLQNRYVSLKVDTPATDRQFGYSSLRGPAVSHQTAADRQGGCCSHTHVLTHDHLQPARPSVVRTHCLCAHRMVHCMARCIAY